MRSVPGGTLDAGSRGRQIACVFALIGAVVCLYSVRQADPDFWGYLAYGRLFVESHGLDVRDPFAYTSSGLQWTTFEYGAQSTLWLVYHAIGPVGLIALKCLLGGAALYFVVLSMRLVSDEPFIWVPVFLLCTSALSRFLLFRPQLFTFAFFAFFVSVLFRFVLRRPAPLWSLPIVMLVWANTHGGFLAGLGAIGLAILLRISDNAAIFGWSARRIADGTRALWIALACCFAATLVNPKGIALWTYVATELSHNTNRQYIAEWMPASLHRDAWSTITLTMLTVMLATVGSIAHWRRARTSGPPPWCWAVSAVPLVAMAFLSIRHVPLAAIWTGPVIALLATSVQKDLARIGAFRRGWFLLRGLATLPVCLTFAVVYAEPQPKIRIDGNVLGRLHPCGAVAFLRQHEVRGNVYNPLWWGAYISWELYPSIRISMDGRNISLFTDDMVRENLRFYSDGAEQVDLETPLRYQSDFLLVPTNAPVLSRLMSDFRWRRVYADAACVLFERSNHESALPPAADRRDTIVSACPAFLQ
jgi:hypothetical protein